MALAAQNRISQEEKNAFRKRYATVDTEYANVCAERDEMIKKRQDPYANYSPKEAEKLMREEATRRYNILMKS